MFASRTTQVIDIPFDPPHTATIQKLAGRHLDQAQTESQFAAMDTIKRMGGPAVQKEFAALSDSKKEAVVDPLNGYDRYILMKKGIKAWDCETPLSEEAIEDLDADAVDFFARAVLKLSKPSIFLTKEETAVETKNG